MHASIYPETVALAGLMLSPHWVAAAASSRGRDREHFFAEAARRLNLPEYQPNIPSDPLVKWARDKASYALADLADTVSSRNAPHTMSGSVVSLLSESGAAQVGEPPWRHFK